MKKALSILSIIAAAVILSMNQPVRPTTAATVTTGVTFTTNQLVQYYDLNNAVNNATVSAIVSGDITDGTISAADMGANSVTTAKILDGTVTGSDIASRTILGGNIATNTVTDVNLSTNLTFNPGFISFTNNVTMSFMTNQINVLALSTNGSITGNAILNGGSGSAWGSVLNVNMAIYEDQKASTTVGGTATATTWTKHDLTTEVVDTGSLGSVSSSVIALTAGTYRVSAFATFFATGTGKIRLRNTSDNISIVGGNTSANAGGNGGSTAVLNSRFTIAATKNIELQYWVASTSGTSDLGQPASSGEVEVYAGVTFIKE